MTPTVAVVGAGISGLVAALRLRQADLRVILLESSDRVGGVLWRGPVAGNGADGPVIDLGAESLLARRPEAVDLAAELGLAEDLEPPAVARAALYSRGALHPMPSGHLMGVPADAGVVAGLLSAEEVGALAAGLAAVGPPVSSDPTVGGYLGGRLGRPIVDRLVEPLLGGVYAGRVDELSLRSAIPALWPAVQRGEPLGGAVTAALQAAAAGGPAATFTGLRGGVARLAERAAELLVADGVTLRTGTTVTALAPRPGNGFRLRLGRAGGSLDVDGVLLAVPAPSAARLLAASPPTAAASATLAAVELASMALIALRLPRGTLAGVEAAAGTRLSGVLVPAVERRLVKAMTFSSDKWTWAGASGEDLLRISIGRAGEAADLQRPDQDLVRAALADASSLLDLDLSAAVRAGHGAGGVRVIRWGGGLPQYAPGHLERIAAVQRDLAAVPGLEVAGAVIDGVGIPACIATASAAAHRLQQQLSAVAR